MRISDWSSDVCSSDLPPAGPAAFAAAGDPISRRPPWLALPSGVLLLRHQQANDPAQSVAKLPPVDDHVQHAVRKQIFRALEALRQLLADRAFDHALPRKADERRSEEHTSELQSLKRISYAGFCLKT